MVEAVLQGGAGRLAALRRGGWCSAAGYRRGGGMRCERYSGGRVVVCTVGGVCLPRGTRRARAVIVGDGKGWVVAVQEAVLQGVGGLAALGGGTPLLLVERVQGGIAECSGFIVHSLQSAISAGRRAASVRGDGEEARVEGVQGVGERRAGDGEEVLQGV